MALTDELVKELINHPVFIEHQKTHITFLVAPQLRSLVNQLIQCIGIVNTSESVVDCFNNRSTPLDAVLSRPELEAGWQRLAREHPELGSSPAQILTNFKALRNERNAEQHMHTPELIVLELNNLKCRISMAALAREDAFLHASVLSAPLVVDEFLAVPRLYKLAQQVLIHCQNCFSFQPTVIWQFQNSPKVNVVRQWADIVLQALGKELGCADVCEFLRAADKLLQKAKPVGPLRLSYDPEALQRFSAACLESGLFNDKLRTAHPFAYTIVTSMDVLLSHLPES